MFSQTITDATSNFNEVSAQNIALEIKLLNKHFQPFIENISFRVTTEKKDVTLCPRKIVRVFRNVIDDENELWIFNLKED